MERRGPSTFHHLIPHASQPSIPTASPSIGGLFADGNHRQPARDGRIDRMKITFYAHASFRLETLMVDVVTDPCKSGVSGFELIDELADFVITCSATNRFHRYSSHVCDQPAVVNAFLDIPLDGTVTCGIPICTFPASESLKFDFVRNPDANARYLFTIGVHGRCKWAMSATRSYLRL